MKALIIGSSGQIGQAVVKELSSDTELLLASLNNSEYKIDISSSDSIKRLYQKIGKIDHVLCAASRGVVFNSVSSLNKSDFESSLQYKLLGQIDLVLQGIEYISDLGGFTLTTGIMNHDFVAGGSIASMVNSAVEGFVRAAALDLPRGLRINVVSPALLLGSVERYAKICPGFEPVSQEKVARAYRKSIYSIQTGQIYNVCA